MGRIRLIREPGGYQPADGLHRRAVHQVTHPSRRLGDRHMVINSGVHPGPVHRWVGEEGDQSRVHRPGFLELAQRLARRGWQALRASWDQVSLDQLRERFLLERFAEA